MRETDIDRLRRHIDEIDARIVDLLAERTRRREQIQILKQLAGLPPHSPDRENAILEQLLARARSQGLDTTLVGDLFARILAGPRDSALQRSYPHETVA